MLRKVESKAPCHHKTKAPKEEKRGDRLREREEHRENKKDTMSPRAVSPRAVSPRTVSPRAVSPQSKSAKGGDESACEPAKTLALLALLVPLVLLVSVG